MARLQISGTGCRNFRPIRLAGGAPFVVIYLNTKSGSLNQRYALPGSRTVILYSRQSNNEQCRRQQDTSQAAMLADDG